MDHGYPSSIQLRSSVLPAIRALHAPLRSRFV
ncbi:hypothetical protein SAMN05216296_1286 [Pseudomonas pohangensis]|uniref:Uncharacterized protein n=1 Tax=Pseudomonas pohangensis TaxID=364197 RepID=A0A1H2F3C6_9PSED|nr:hypothetical protein SAMN05216296_1286 [Pseudomonas pohangensis]